MKLPFLKKIKLLYGMQYIQHGAYYVFLDTLSNTAFVGQSSDLLQNYTGRKVETNINFQYYLMMCHMAWV